MSKPSGKVRETRTRWQGRLSYSCEGGPPGHARWLDVSRVGACILLGRQVEPGSELRLCFESPLVSGDGLEVVAHVMWCRQVQHGPEFVAGLRIRRDTPEMALSFAVLGYAARDAENKWRTAPVEAAAAMQAAGRIRSAVEYQPAALALAQAV